MNETCDGNLAQPDAQKLRQRIEWARASRMPVVTGVRPAYTVTVGTEIYVVIIDAPGAARCSCAPEVLAHWPDACLHAAAALEYDTSVRLAAQGPVRRELRDCAETGIVTRDLLVPYHQALHRRREDERSLRSNSIPNSTKV